MNSGVEKLLKFINKKTSIDCQKFLSLAYSSFFEDFLMEGYSMDLHQIMQIIGEDRFSQVHPCALEFFFSNEYPSPDNPRVLWNVIDVFLKSQEKKLSEQEKSYLRGMRDSYMSVYEVVDVKLDESLTLKDMIQGGEPVVVREKSATHHLVKWDRIGARIVHTEDCILLAGAALPLSREAADNAANSLRFIMQGFKKMMTVHMLKKVGLTKETAFLLHRKLWVKEIASVFIATPPALPEFFNSDDDPLQFCHLTFEIKATKRAIIDILNQLPELYHHESAKKTELCWVWLLKGKRKAKKKIASPHNKGMVIETQIQDLITNQSYPVFAEFTLRGKKLVINVNSRQRAYILEDYITTHFGDLVDAGNIVLDDMQTLTNPSKTKRKPPSKKAKLSHEEREMLDTFKDNYYREWITSPVPALNNRTPKQASKTAAGRKELVELLKYIQNNENHNASPDEPAYDFTWIWRELGIDMDTV